MGLGQEGDGEQSLFGEGEVEMGAARGPEPPAAAGAGSLVEGTWAISASMVRAISAEACAEMATSSASRSA
jgi:hypothetical protein